MCSTKTSAWPNPNPIPNPNPNPKPNPKPKPNQVAAINLLRGVTPPRDAPGAAAAEEYGRYGAEDPAQRYERVLYRPADALFCMQNATTYSLSANPSPPTPHGATAAGAAGPK